MQGDAYRALSNKVRAFDREVLIKSVARVSSARMRNPDQVTRTFRPYLKNPAHSLPDFVLAEIIKCAILIEDRRYYHRDRIPSDRDIAYLQQLYFNVDGEVRLEDIDDLEMFMFRLAALQFPSQGSTMLAIPRSILLHREYTANVDQHFDVPRAFEEALGISLDDFTFLGASIAALAITGQNGVLDLDFLSQIDATRYSSDTVQAFLNVVSTDYDSFRQVCSAKCDPVPSLEVYEYNPLRETPILRLPSDEVVLPIPRLLIERVTSGIYYDLAQSHGNEFLTYLGHAYQHYVGLLFGDIDDLEVLPEKEYGGRARRRLSPDWILRHDRGSVIECKTKRLRLGSRLPQLRQQLEEDVRTGISTAVEQLGKSIEDIRTGLVYPDLKACPFVPLVATLDHAYLLNGNPVRALVTKDLEAKGIEPIDYQVASVEELEYLSALQNPEEIMQVIWEKFESLEERSHDLKTAISNRGGLRVHPLLTKTHKKFMERMGLDGVTIDTDS